MFKFPRNGFICALAIVSATILYGIYKRVKSRTKELKPPMKWKAVGKLKSLCMYPLMSGHRSEIREADCTHYGFVKTFDGFDWIDRSFLAYDPETMESKNARVYPKLVLINIKFISWDKFSLSAPDADETKINLPPLDVEPQIKILMHNDLIDCWDCGDQASEFISKISLKSSSGLRLAYRDASADDVFYHLVNKTSVDKLNKELKIPFSEHAFRPNFYIYGHQIKAWEEESWEWIKIGKAIFRNCKPLAGLDENGVALRTFEKVTLVKNSMKDHSGIDHPVMGIHLKLHTEGKVHVHDQVYVS